MQETLLRAWRRRETLERDEWFRAWLYRIATNACLDNIKAKGRRVRDGRVDQGPAVDPALSRPAARRGEIIARETIELTFLAVIQLLPPRQRAVLIMRDVLEWAAEQVAEVLELSVAAVNSALQRARATSRPSPGERRGTGAPEASEAERELLAGLHRRPRARRRRRGARADQRRHPHHDAAAPLAVRGHRRCRAPARAGLRPGARATGGWCRPPPTASRRPPATCARTGDDTYRAFKLDVPARRRTAGSPRSRRSTPRCSSSSGCRRPSHRFLSSS